MRIGSSALTPIYKFALVGALVVGCVGQVDAAEKVRFYFGGESDPGAMVGGVALTTQDHQEPPVEDMDGDPVFDAAGDFVALEAPGENRAPTYVAGRTAGLALQFDGNNDEMRSPAFDPRNFSTFASLSQAWVKPSVSGRGDDQTVWALGTDNGGVGITDDGFWRMQSVSGISRQISPVAVSFDEWTHVAVFRGGNSASLYLDGALAIRAEGFWSNVGDVILGSDVDGFGFFNGVIDDFNIAGFSDFVFDEVRDIDFVPSIPPSEVFGDVDQDGDVDSDDYLIWSENVGFDNEQGAGDFSTLLMGDVDGNGRINYFDFEVIASEAAAAGAPLPAIPEPASIGLASFGALAFAAWFRRRK